MFDHYFTANFSLTLFCSVRVGQGSSLSDGGIFNQGFSRDLLLNLLVKIENSLAFGKVRAKNRVVPFFRIRCRQGILSVKCKPYQVLALLSEEHLLLRHGVQ